MLKLNGNNIDLEKERIKALEFIPEEAKQFIKDNSFSTLNIKYPVTRYPVKPKSLNIVKENKFQGELCGIKGQYLIFSDDTVFNIRSNEGVVLDLDLV
jgi:thiamine pyrophosphokinase